MVKNALLGLHSGRNLVEAIVSRFQAKGYSVDITRNAEEMLGHATEKEYDRYFMDLNLGDSNSPDVTPAISVYDVVRGRVESGEAKFVGISGNSDAVSNAQRRGIPAYRGLMDFNLNDFLD